MRHPDPISPVQRATFARTLAAVSSLAWTLACGGTPAQAPNAKREPTRPSERQPAPQQESASPDRVVKPTAGKTVDAIAPGTHQATTPRIVAVGDVHGDFEATRTALRLAGAIDPADKWIGGALVVIQTGDQLDRGDGERQILDLFARLEVEAKAAGGAFIPLNGNHELMNAAGDFRYVTPGGFTAFADLASQADDAKLSITSLSPEQIGRAVAFAPGGPYAKQFAARDVIHIHDRTVFAHGGVLPSHVAYGLENINAETKAWLAGDRAEPPSIAMDPEAPVWTRRFSSDTTQEDCKVLVEVLRLLDVDRMVVAHTVQAGGITSACNDLVWRIDVGLSAHYSGPIEVLELSPTSAKVLRGTRGG